MNLEGILERFGGTGGLAHHLHDACAPHSVVGSAIVLVGEDECYTATFGRDRAGDPFQGTTRLNVSCGVKLFVSAFVGALINGGEVGVEDEIAKHLDFGDAALARVLDGITIRHLLSHTDGIGYRRLEFIPTDGGGFVDVPRVAAAIASDERQFRPGQYCAEGHCGFGLLGALVEKHWRMPLAEILQQELLDPLCTGAAAVQSAMKGSVCPSSGRGLDLSAAELGPFLRLHLSPESFDLPLLERVDSFSMLFEHQIAYPGWNPTTTGCALGWKTFADGWVGHNGVRPGNGRDGQTVFIRLHPQKRIALAFLSVGNTPAATASLGRLFAHFLPELGMQSPPRLLTDEEQLGFDAAKFVGSFGNKARRIAVSEPSQGTLRVATYERGSSDAPTAGEGVLAPATRDSFFVRQPNTSGMFFFQYLRSENSTDFDLAWDIRSLWKRCSCH